MSWNDPNQGGVLVEGCRCTCMEGGVTYFDLAIVSPFMGVSGELLTRVTNRKLDWILGVNTNV